MRTLKGFSREDGRPLMPRLGRLARTLLRKRADAQSDGQACFLSLGNSVILQPLDG